jgi:anthranilate phosphoribosyltransferase
MMAAPIEVDRMAKDIVNGSFDIDSVKASLMEMSLRGERPEEILSLVTAFHQASVPVITRHRAVADLCGTGGAPFRTFNVSTIASLVVSSLGVPVAKHGNRSNKGPCGSADLLEALGAEISLPPEEAGRMLDEIDFTFLFAPTYHPAMRHAAPVRKIIKDRTVFNMLGPLLNPVAAEHRQLIGVYSPRLLEIIPPTLAAMGSERAMVVYGEPGMDEVSILGPTRVAELRGNKIDRYFIDPGEYGFSRPERKEVADLPPVQAVEATLEVLSGLPGPRRNMVVINAACALYVYGRVIDIAKGVLLAERAIDSGAALHRLEDYLKRSRPARGMDDV